MSPLGGHYRQVSLDYDYYHIDHLGGEWQMSINVFPKDISAAARLEPRTLWSSAVQRHIHLSTTPLLLWIPLHFRCSASQRPHPDGPCHASTSIPHLFLSLLLSLCALLVKEHAATILGVCLCYDAIVTSRDTIVTSWPVLLK